MEEDKDLIASLGLDIQNLFATQGMVCAQKFVEVLATLKEEAVNTPTKATIVDNFAMWGTTTAPEVKTPLLVDNAGAIYSLISFLSTAADDSVPGEKEYKGKGYVAQKLADMLSTVGMMDQTQALVKTFAPFAYNAAEEILSKKVTFEVKPMMQSFDTNPGTTHVEVIIKLIKTIPYSGTVSIDNAIPVLASILLDATLPAKLKTEARTTFNQQSNVNKEHVLKSGNEIMALIEAGGNEALLMMYVQHAELYTNAPAAVHKNLDIFLKQSFQMYCSLYSNIGRLHPRVLLPHVEYFITQMSSFPVMGSLVLMIFESIAGVAPEEFYPYLEKVRPLASNVQNGEMFYAKIVGKLSSATVPANAPDNCLHLLTELLTNHKEGGCVPVIFNEIANVMVNLSDKKALIAALPLLAKHRGTNEVVYTSIDDFANGRSLTVISAKVDELDKKVNALNNKVAETCSNLSDVIAYVDANMADMKDFLAEVVKKLPQPKRLQIDGTLRKALVLVFECSRTGLEFGIVSHEWSKWLKIGFSLVKAGQAVIDLGMGNPLGILKKGVECVQEIYTAYKTNDDDEFNTYITQPFLTSAEQDQLLIKLRDQNFFDKFAYDAQTHGWYLLHPEEDGMEVYAADKSSGMLGSAYGALKTAVGIAAEFVPMAESIKSGMENAESGVSSVKEALSSKKNNEGSERDEARNPINSSGTSNKVAPAPSPAINNSANRATNVGPRAAALKETFSGATNASAEDKLQQANALVAANRKIEDLEGRMSALEKQVTALANQPKSGGCCTIC